MAQNRALEYAGGDEEFAEWLEAIDKIVFAKITLSVFDLEDMMFRDNFDAGDTPEEFVNDVVVETVRDNYGEKYAELLEG